MTIRPLVTCQDLSAYGFNINFKKKWESAQHLNQAAKCQSVHARWTNTHIHACAHVPPTHTHTETGVRQNQVCSYRHFLYVQYFKYFFYCYHIETFINVYVHKYDRSFALLLHSVLKNPYRLSVMSWLHSKIYRLKDGMVTLARCAEKRRALTDEINSTILW